MPAAPAMAQTLNFAVGAPVTSIDPHYHNLSPNNALAGHIFESLADFDPRHRLGPGLAESWRVVDENTWEFKLRRGVKFHNGQDFTAEDVAFTIARVPTVPNSPSSFAIYTRAAREVQVVDPYTVRIRTNGPYPLMPVDIASIYMLDSQTHRDPKTEDFNSGRLAVGTGPYRFVSYRPGDRVELARNDAHWGERQPWERVNYRMITNDSARTAALLAGDVDVIDQVPTSDIARLRSDQRTALAEITSLRIIYLHLDRSRPAGQPTPMITDNNGQPIPNPLHDGRVRRALSMAIDRKAIVERVMEGAAIPSGQFLPPGTYSYAPGLQPPAYDPDGAKRLLAEAGLPNGFRISLHGPNDRYMNDARIIQAIGQMWTRIGVRTEVQPLPWTTFTARAGRQEFAAFLVGWGSGTGEASSPLRSLVATFDRNTGFGAANRGRFSNPEMDGLLRQALGTVDDERREQILIRATEVAMRDVGIIPIHNQINYWAHRRAVQVTARADELSQAMSVRPAR
ncbi:MAG: ABC transporter substrate-binding protein [Alphaproteobacteria bacterium]|nr:ABC transporter substrate-binding protein [Alphaproteobacteria bacterium]